MSILDIRSAERVFWGGTEARRVYKGGRLIWGSLDPDAVNLINRMTVKPDITRRRLISDMVEDAKGRTWWGKADAVGIMAAHDAQAARLNWRRGAYNLLLVNGPAFTVDRGYRSNGTTSYLDTQFNPFTATAVNHVQNSASLVVRSNTDNVETGSLAGYYDGSKGTTINPRSTGNRATVRVNSTGFQQGATDSVMSSIGMYAASRTASNAMALYKDGVTIASGTTASVAPADGNLRLGGISSESLRANEMSMWYIGAGLTQTEVQSLYDWFEPYRIAIELE